MRPSPLVSYRAIDISYLLIQPLIFIIFHLGFITLSFDLGNELDSLFKVPPSWVQGFWQKVQVEGLRIQGDWLKEGLFLPSVGLGLALILYFATQSDMPEGKVLIVGSH